MMFTEKQATDWDRHTEADLGGGGLIGEKFGCLYRESLNRDWSGPPLRSVSGPPLMKISGSTTGTYMI